MPNSTKTDNKQSNPITKFFNNLLPKSSELKRSKSASDIQQVFNGDLETEPSVAYIRGDEMSLQEAAEKILEPEISNEMIKIPEDNVETLKKMATHDKEKFTTEELKSEEIKSLVQWLQKTYEWCHKEIIASRGKETKNDTAFRTSAALTAYFKLPCKDLLNYLTNIASQKEDQALEQNENDPIAKSNQETKEALDKIESPLIKNKNPDTDNPTPTVLSP